MKNWCVNIARHAILCRKVGLYNGGFSENIFLISPIGSFLSNEMEYCQEFHEYLSGVF